MIVDCFLFGFLNQPFLALICTLEGWPLLTLSPECWLDLASDWVYTGLEGRRERERGRGKGGMGRKGARLEYLFFLFPSCHSWHWLSLHDRASVGCPLFHGSSSHPCYGNMFFSPCPLRPRDDNGFLLLLKSGCPNLSLFCLFVCFLNLAHFCK